MSVAVVATDRGIPSSTDVRTYMHSLCQLPIDIEYGNAVIRLQYFNEEARDCTIITVANTKEQQLSMV
jgi:hypothetical protein